MFQSEGFSYSYLKTFLVIKREILLAQFKVTLHKGVLRQWKQTESGLQVSIEDVVPKICEVPSTKLLIKPCQGYTKWNDRQRNHSLFRTKTNNSFVTVNIYKSLSAKLYIGRIDIETYDRRGIKKRQGGDSWRAIVNGTEQQLSVEITDLSNGSYRGWFSLLYPGEFSLNLALEHSLCEGITDPPFDWFKKGIFISYN